MAHLGNDALAHNVHPISLTRSSGPMINTHGIFFRRRTIFRADRSLARYEKHLRQTWGKPDERPREDQLDEVRAAIETGCDHGYWRRVQAVSKKHPGHCQLCKYVGWKFIFQCENCPLTSCWACHTDGPPEILLVEEGADAEAR